MLKSPLEVEFFSIYDYYHGIFMFIKVKPLCLIMKISGEYFDRYTCRRVLHTAPSGQFIFDGYKINRCDNGLFSHLALQEDINVSSTSAKRDQTIKTSPKYRKQKQVTEPDIPEIVMFSKSSSHYSIHPPVYTYLQDKRINDANQKRADEINLFRSVFYDDAHPTLKNEDSIKIERMNRLMFPSRRRLQSLERLQH